jgi:hypothetical protein
MAVVIIVDETAVALFTVTCPSSGSVVVGTQARVADNTIPHQRSRGMHCVAVHALVSGVRNAVMVPVRVRDVGSRRDRLAVEQVVPVGNATAVTATALRFCQVAVQHVPHSDGLVDRRRRHVCANRVGKK